MTDPILQDPCESCLNHEECNQTLKGRERCSKYDTKVIELFDGNLVSFKCEMNGKISEWRKREECDAFEIAAEINVHPKYVWKLLVSDDVPIEIEPIPLHFDLTNLTPEKKRSIRFETAKWLMEKYHFITLKENETTYIYKDGVYIDEAEEVIVNTIRTVLGEECTTFDRNEVKSMIRDLTLASREIFNNTEHKICVENGVLNLLTKKFENHSPKQYFLTKIPVTYDPDAKCPKIDEFFNQIVAETDVQTLYEVPGYCLWDGYEIHKAIMLVGGGENGKSVYLNLVKNTLGPKNVSSISLQKLSQSRFASSALVEKYANIYPDIPSQALSGTGTFKMLTGNDLIGAEYKFGKDFTFQNRAKLLFSANKIPETEDDTDAYFRRWIILVFPNKFTEHTIPKRDLNLLEKLSTPEELSGFLNKALEALTGLLERGAFHGDKPTAEWRIDYIRKSDPIKAFYLDCLKEVSDREVYIKKSRLYEKFVQYCKESKLPPVDNVVFSRKIKKHFELAQDSTAMIPKKTRVWRCLRLKTKEEMEKEQAEGGPSIDDYFNQNDGEGEQG
ncbi:MAG: phage/plasmid primase, P4 family [Candidatus Hodarchaeota archaeon]